MESLQGITNDRWIIKKGARYMSRPKAFNYDQASKEIIIKKGVDGAVPTWVGISMERQIMHVVCDEGVCNVDGDGLDIVTRPKQQENFEGNELDDFYQENKVAVDAFISAAMELWAKRRGKTGVIKKT